MDKGNYDYVDLNEPKVEGLEDVHLMTLSELVISPKFSDDRFLTEDYAFEWKAVDKNLSMEPVVIGTESELRY